MTFRKITINFKDCSGNEYSPEFKTDILALENNDGLHLNRGMDEVIEIFRINWDYFIAFEHPYEACPEFLGCYREDNIQELIDEIKRRT